MKTYFNFIAVSLWATVGCQAATLIPNQSPGISLPGIYYDYYNVRFSSLTGETGADANVYGDSLKISFGNFGGATSGSGLKFDFSTAHVGFVVQSEYPSAVISDLQISATGTYSAAASMAVGSWAEVITQIPFNLQVVGVNGIPYTEADLVRGYSLNVLPSQVTVVQNGDRVESGFWNATWSIAGLGASLASIFNLPTMDITALDLAITPDLSNMSMDGTSSLEAIGLRVDTETNTVSVAELLEPTRKEDAGDDLWSVYNVVQEKLIHGMFNYSYASNFGKDKERKARRVKNFQQDMQINSDLYSLALQYA